MSSGVCSSPTTAEPSETCRRRPDGLASTFDRLLTDRSEEDLTALITWGLSGENEFWADHLDQRKGDPAQFLSNHIERLAEDHERWRRGRERYERTRQADDPTPPKQESQCTAIMRYA